MRDLLRGQRSRDLVPHPHQLEQPLFKHEIYGVPILCGSAKKPFERQHIRYTTTMPADFAPILAALKAVLAKYEKQLALKADSAAGYSVDSKVPPPFPQHKGQPLAFGAVRVGKGYVSFHLLPVYMCPELIAFITPALKKRMQGKACFNFKALPAPDLLSDLELLTKASTEAWQERGWL